jgi:hypothetical protein
MASREIRKDDTFPRWFRAGSKSDSPMLELSSPTYAFIAIALGGLQELSVGRSAANGASLVASCIKMF